MRAVSGRHKILLGALGLVAVAWTVDYFSGGGKTAVVRAANAVTAAPLPTAAGAPAASGVAELLASIAAAPPAAPPLELDRLERDLFVPTAALKAACNAVETDPAVEAAAQEEEPASEEIPFEQRHELQGILTGGRLPLAIIDGQLFATGARLDGYMVTRIERDRVECERGAQRVVLILNARDE